MGEETVIMDDEGYGERIPESYDIEALAKLLEADCQQHLLDADAYRKIGEVLNTYLKQFRSTDNT